ncbi:hypothetical protein VNI00_013323 [Paramarasmius palmivorus]|uniref:Glucose-methanol-choline oxidoreductase N-terminal domain-containing protein n=1 Tax=Paramarasmius palmivorus TaxID=297713 RepID=A0AAW0C052_9AGAR
MNIGLTVAARLTEDESVSVAVIEAGWNWEGVEAIYIPGLYGTIGVSTFAATINWLYPTVPQAHGNNRTLTINAGKALGGSSTINAMIFANILLSSTHPRALKDQYDTWGALNNDTSWTWDSLLPFFRKSENFTTPTNTQLARGVDWEPEVHGFEGHVHASFPDGYLFPASSLFIDAAEDLGWTASPDLTNGETNAVGFTPFSIDGVNKTRCSAACASYKPFVDRPNYEVIMNATVTRIIWSETSDNSSLTAMGVEYILNGETHVANVTSEVLLAAGTIGSPKILELSGVGNSTILQSAGVNPVLDLPTVGENLADHIHSWVNAITTPETLTKEILGDPQVAQQQLELWYENRTGMYAGAYMSLGFAAPLNLLTQERLEGLLAEAENNLTHYATEFSNGNTDLAKGIEAQHKLALSLYQQNRETVVEYYMDAIYGGPSNSSDLPPSNFSTINTVFQAPLSRGRSHISSSEPNDVPLIDPAYWAHPLDRAVHVAAIQYARKLIMSPPLDSIHEGEFEPGPNITTDEEVEEYLRDVFHPDNHEIGTLSMLPRELGGVVDTKLKVYGIGNVRAIDASIIPIHISSHTSSTVYMIAERAADIIKSDRLQNIHL